MLLIDSPHEFPVSPMQDPHTLGSSAGELFIGSDKHTYTKIPSLPTAIQNHVIQATYT